MKAAVLKSLPIEGWLPFILLQTLFSNLESQPV
jgi:hypothetical protein